MQEYFWEFLTLLSCNLVWLLAVTSSKEIFRLTGKPGFILRDDNSNKR